MKLIKSYHILLLLCFSFSLRAQRASALAGDLISQLENSVRSGQKKSLRDLGSLLNKEEGNEQALDVLQRYTMFTAEEMDLSKSPSKAEFLNFYYDNEPNFQFSELTGNFYLSPLEERKIKTKIESVDVIGAEKALSLLHKTEESIIEAIQNKMEGKLIKKINFLKKLDLPEADLFLLDLADQLRVPSDKQWSPAVYQSLSEALVYTSDIRSLESILGLLTENRIEAKVALSQLAMISNISLPKETSKRAALQQYKYFIDSLGTLENIRMYGYEKLFDFRPAFFKNIADYFGRVLCFANGREWLVHNAINDLIKTTHPRALFYMSAVGFKNEYHYPDVSYKFTSAVTDIQKLTHFNLGVENQNGTMVTAEQGETDRQTKLNFLTYWATKYNDYEWDASRDMFVNKHQALEKTQHYERLFRRLNSRNDSVAMASFKQLTEGDPSEIIALANKYRQMFRSYNQTLPPFKYKYLEQLAELTLFCRRYKISYEPSKNLSGLLKELCLASDQSERYNLENKIIENISNTDITPLEYWACVHQENEENNFSVGRILDIYYSKHWNEILKDNLQLRLFLKKADLYKNIGVIGVCNTYLNKFDLNQAGLKERLKSIQKEETDEQILNQIAQLAAFNDSEEASAFSDFIAEPLYFDKRDIKILPPPTLDDLKQVIQMIQEETENGVIGKLFFYLRLHPTLKSVPHLMELAANDRVIAEKRGKTVTLGDQVTPILERIFNYDYPMTATDKIYDIRPWLEKWGTDQANYLKWPKSFFEEKMTFLEEQEELSIDDINLITESQNYDSTYKEFILKSLLKVKPTKNIRSLNIEPKLSITTDLQYFETFEFSYKELDDIPKLFELNDPATLLKFLIQRADLFEMEKKGSFYNNMFRHAWFSTYLNSGDADLVTVAYVQQTLETYLDESEYMSEYEEQITTLHVAQLQNIGKPLEERLLAPFDLNADVSAKAKIQETIISTVSYEEIGIIAKHFAGLSATLGKEPWAFLYRDFGIPVFNLNEKQAYISFRRNLNNMTEYELYFHYIKKFGVDFYDKKGNLDYEKIANILRFDSVTPFVGGGGGKRDYHGYGIIKLLELTFATRLGFHEKLNESQSFYTFSTAKRNKAWIDFLLERNLILIPEEEAPSFNRLVE
ncbi:MAG: hypothetical protein ACI8YQ_003080 [Polaribacter sp.]|jgi:hypothetical protein